MKPLKLLFLILFALLLIIYIVRQTKLKNKQISSEIYILKLSVKLTYFFLYEALVMFVVAASTFLFRLKIPTFSAILIFIAFIFLILSAAFARRKVIVKGDMILFFPAFHKVKKFTFYNIRLVKQNIQYDGTITYSVYLKNKLFTISSKEASEKLFLNTLKQNRIYFLSIDEQIKKNIKSK